MIPKQQVDVLKVLIADDNAPTRMMLRAAIKQWGYEAVEAADGEQAWNILQEASGPRLLVLDWLMPKLNGVELSERIRKELSYHPYIILLTQMSGTENIIKGLDAGADEFLSKPFNMAELRSRLSVGARIIKSEKELGQKNLQLKNYGDQLKTISTYLQELSKQIDIMTSSVATVNSTNLQEIRVMLDNAMNVVNKNVEEE